MKLSLGQKKLALLGLTCFFVALWLGKTGAFFVVDGRIPELLNTITFLVAVVGIAVFAICVAVVVTVVDAFCSLFKNRKKVLRAKKEYEEMIANGNKIGKQIREKFGILDPMTPEEIKAYDERHSH